MTALCEVCGRAVSALDVRLSDGSCGRMACYRLGYTRALAERDEARRAADEHASKAAADRKLADEWMNARVRDRQWSARWKRAAKEGRADAAEARGLLAMSEDFHAHVRDICREAGFEALWVDDAVELMAHALATRADCEKELRANCAEAPDASQSAGHGPASRGTEGARAPEQAPTARVWCNKGPVLNPCFGDAGHDGECWNVRGESLDTPPWGKP